MLFLRPRLVVEIVSSILQMLLARPLNADENDLERHEWLFTIEKWKSRMNSQVRLEYFLRKQRVLTDEKQLKTIQESLLWIIPKIESTFKYPRLLYLVLLCSFTSFNRLYSLSHPNSRFQAVTHHRLPLVSATLTPRHLIETRCGRFFYRLVLSTGTVTLVQRLTFLCAVIVSVSGCGT